MPGSPTASALLARPVNPSAARSSQSPSRSSSIARQPGTAASSSSSIEITRKVSQARGLASARDRRRRRQGNPDRHRRCAAGRPSDGGGSRVGHAAGHHRAAAFSTARCAGSDDQVLTRDGRGRPVASSIGMAGHVHGDSRGAIARIENFLDSGR